MMAVKQVKFRCTCGKILKAPSYAQGRTARCPACQSLTIVPYEDCEIEALNRIMDLSDQLPSKSKTPTAATSTAEYKTCRHCSARVPVADEVCPHCELLSDTSVMLTAEMASKLRRAEQRRKRSGDAR